MSIYFQEIFKNIIRYLAAFYVIGTLQSNFLLHKNSPEYQPDTPGIIYSFTSKATASVHTVSQN